MNEPFLYDKVFAVSNNMQGNILFSENNKILVIDNLFKNYSELQKVVFSSSVGNWKYKNGTKNYIDYYDCRLSFLDKPYEIFNVAKTIIEEQYGKNSFAVVGHPEANWFKQINAKRANYAVPHQDNFVPNANLYTCLVYLNSEEDCFGGTAFFNKLKDDSVIEDLDYWGSDPSCWEKLGHVEMKPNRLVIFPANLYHSAYHPVNGYYNTPRITLVWWMKEGQLNGNHIR